jgi:hypothetical protein
MSDPFTGTWKLNPSKSKFDPNHRPSEATMQWEAGPDGKYLMTARGINAKGEPVAERPQTFVPDGRPYPVPDFPGLASVTTRPRPDTIRAEVRREDGSLAGEGTYVVAPDGQSLTATTAGFDTQLRRFETTTAWDRIG